MASRNLPLVDWLKIEASAPGKFIISGEYSVVYEKQAIAAAIDLRTRVVIEPNNVHKVRLTLKNLNSVREWPIEILNPICRLVSKYSDCLEFSDTMPVKLNSLLHPRFHENQQTTSPEDGPSDPPADGDTNDPEDKKEIDKKADDAVIGFLLLYLGLSDSYASSARPSISVEVDSTIPVGSGLGSSSAYSVALCGALMRVFRVSAEKYIMSTWAFNVDKFFHGRPSGVDNSTITTGGYILFQGGKIKANGIPHKTPSMVLLVDTGVSRSTRALSQSVVQQLHEDSTRVNNIFNNINDITTSIWRRMNDPEFLPKNIYTHLRQNQELLNALGVGHARLEDICARAQCRGFVAKQTGAGGGGTAFILYEPTEDEEMISKLKSELVRAGYSAHEHSVGSEGLTVKVTPHPDRQFVLGKRGDGLNDRR